jgi:Uma2 family endonuclease
MSTNPKTLLTPEEYIEIERRAERKSEYFRGEMFAMSGASREHNLLVVNMVAALHSQLRSGPCEVYPSHMRIRVADTGLYTYPDVIVTCGEPRFLDRELDTLVNPAVIFEVLSPSTEAYDRGRKFEYYEALGSLQHYVLVASDRLHVDLFTRQPDGSWMRRSYGRPEDSLSLDSIGCRLLLSDLYEKVSFESK